MDISRLTTYKIAVLALWNIGGATSPQHVEDVAAQCFKLAPSRFSWKRYPHYPSISVAYQALRHAKREINGAFASGGNSKGWLLTASGLEWAQNAQPMPPNAGGMKGRSALRPEDLSDIESLQSHKTFKAWHSQIEDIQAYEIADAVHLTADAPRDIVVQRIDELSNKAQLAGMYDLKEYLAWLRANA